MTSGFLLFFFFLAKGITLGGAGSGIPCGAGGLTGACAGIPCGGTVAHTGIPCGAGGWGVAGGGGGDGCCGT